MIWREKGKVMGIIKKIILVLGCIALVVVGGRLVIYGIWGEFDPVFKGPLGSIGIIFSLLGIWYSTRIFRKK